MIRRRRWLVLFVLVVCVGAAFAVNERADPVYRSESALACRPPTQTVELLGLVSPRDQTPEERSAVCAERAGRRELVEAVVKKLRLPVSAAALDGRIQSRSEARTNLVVVTVEDGNARVSTEVANAMASEMARRERRAAQRNFDNLIRTARREYRRALSREDDAYARFRRRELREQLARIETARDFTRPVEITEKASLPTSPVSPKKGRNIALGAAAGLLLGIMAAFLRSSFDRRLRGAREIEAEVDLPMLGSARESALGRVNFGDPAGEGKGKRNRDAELDLESFRILHTNLAYLSADRPVRRVLVTSALPEEGKSTVAASLAVVAGLAGERVLLLEADLRRPVLAGWLDAEPTPGLTEYLTGQADAREVIRAVALGPAGAGNGASDGDGEEPPMLSAILAGKPPPRPAELLRSQRFADFAAVTARSYDLMIIDAPPLLAVTDALDLIPHVDAIVLCVRDGKTTREGLRAATEALARLPARPTGYVVTGVTQKTDGDYSYHGYAYTAPRR